MKPRNITVAPAATRFGPFDAEAGPEPVVMTADELEALRLVDYEGLVQEEAAVRMGVSRGTVWRCLTSARLKVAAMLVEARRLEITDGTGPGIEQDAGDRATGSSGNG